MEILGFREFQLLLEDVDPLTTAPAVGTDMPAPTPPPPPAPDLGTGAPSDLPPDPNAAPTTQTAPTELKFVFIQEAPLKKWHGEFDKNGGTKKFTVFGVSPEDLTKWLEAHNSDSDVNVVKAALFGKRAMPASLYHDFKREVETGELGTDKGSIDITFDSDKDFDNPATDDLDVVFLKSTK